jgi:hypothetical protein
MNITRAVREQYEIVRASGEANMLDYNSVLVSVMDNDLGDLLGWMMYVTKREYGVAVISGKLTKGSCGD